MSKDILLATSIVKEVMQRDTRMAVELKTGEEEEGTMLRTFAMRRHAQIRPEGVVNRILGVTSL